MEPTFCYCIQTKILFGALSSTKNRSIYRPNMKTIECHFHGETAVHILLEEDACTRSVRTRPVPGRRKSLKRGKITLTELVVSQDSKLNGNFLHVDLSVFTCH